MHKFIVELRVSFNKTKTLEVMASSHRQAKFKAEHSSRGMVVLSTEFII